MRTFPIPFALLPAVFSAALGEEDDDGGGMGIVLPADYNKNLSPPGKTLIKVAHDVRDISEVNDADFSITLILNQLQNWNDSRVGVNAEVFETLAVKDRSAFGLMPCLELLTLDVFQGGTPCPPTSTPGSGSPSSASTT